MFEFSPKQLEALALHRKMEDNRDEMQEAWHQAPDFAEVVDSICPCWYSIPCYTPIQRWIPQPRRGDS